MYIFNFTFPIFFKLKFLRYLVMVNLGKRVLSLGVCGSLKKLGVLFTSNFDWQPDMHAGHSMLNNKSPDR